MQTLFGKTLEELVEIAKSVRLPSFAARQIAEWQYGKDVSDVNEITNLSKPARAILSAKYDSGRYPPETVQISSDGTRKYLYRLASGNCVESVYIPESDRATLCISSQAGCRMACRFCMTGQSGFRGNLSSAEILNQIWSIPERDNLTNIVYMGMGEPADNIDEVLKSLEIMTSRYGYGWSHKRITVSTVGIADGLDRLLNGTQCRIAVSLHSPFDEERRMLIPSKRLLPVSEILEKIEGDAYPQRRVSFEYIMFAGLNDTPKHATALVRMLGGKDFRLNLIRFHKIPGSALSPSDEATTANFKDSLNAKGLLTTVRTSRGEDIFAACGMLSAKQSKKQEN
jgi:23S rRNA (adenine2503-C2)-methyltransferase